MRKILLLVFLLNIALVLVSLVILPDRLASHFSRGGLADGWSSKTGYVALILIIEIPVFAMFYWSHFLLTGFNRKFISLPNRDHWLTEENLPQARKILSDAMASFGVATFLLLLAVNGMTILANYQEPPRLNEALFLPIFISYMVYTLYWTVRMITAFGVKKS